MTTTEPARKFVLPGDAAGLRLTVYAAEDQHYPGGVQVWGRVSGSEWRRPADDDGTGPYTLMSLRLNGRVYDGRLREAMLDIKDMHDNARGNWQVALADALAVLGKVQPLDDGGAPRTETPAQHPPLTLDTARLLSRLSDMQGRRVRFIPDGFTDAVTGTLRHVLKSDSDAFLTGADDVRDGRVRITLDLGSDVYLPVPAVLTRMVEQAFGTAD